MTSGLGFFFLVLLLLALFQEGRCAELLLLLHRRLGLALGRLLVGRDRDVDRLRSAQAQLGHLDAQVLVRLVQVVFPIEYCVCQNEDADFYRLHRMDVKHRTKQLLLAI